jgi:hypothetical protein
MTLTLHAILLLAALVLFLLAALNVKSPMNLVAAGLACWVATLLF